MTRSDSVPGRGGTVAAAPDAAGVVGQPAAVAGTDDRAIPALIRRNTLLLAASQAIVGTGNQMVPTLTALMIEQLLRSVTFSGLGYSALGVSRFLVAYPLGRLSDRHGRRVGLLLGLALSFAGSVGLGLSQFLQSFPLFCATLLLFGLGVGAAQQLRLAAADMFPPSRRAEGLGYVLTGSLVGAMGGPILINAAQVAAPALGLDAIATAWIFIPTLILPCMFLVSLIRPDPRDIALNLASYYPASVLAGEASRPSPAPLSIRTLLADTARLTAIANSAAAQGTMAMMMAMTPLTLAHHGHTLPEISMAVALHVLGMFAFSLPLGRLCDAVGRRPVLLVGAVVSAVGAFLVPASPDYWVATAGIFLVGLGWSCSYVATSAVIADTTLPSERGRAVGVNDTVSGAAAIAAPILGGLLIQYAGMPSLGIASFAFLLLPFLMVLTMPETLRRRAATPSR